MRGFYHAKNIIKVLTGLRRCGKSSIMQLACKKLIKDGIPKDFIWLG